MSNNKIKLLFIAGFSRSGSTILGDILGQIDGFFHAGEFRYIWDYGLIENRLCGCGTAFRECTVWGAILNDAFGGMDEIDSHEMLRLRESGARTRHIPLMLTPWGKNLLKSRLKNYLYSLKQLYCAIQSSTGCKVIIDSTKRPAEGYLLGMIPRIDLYIVHLCRDPRAVAYSWLRKKFIENSGDFMGQHNMVVTSFYWAIHNIATEAFWRHFPERYLMLRYEDFVYRPQESVRRILNLVQEKALHLPFVGKHSVKLRPNHTIWGNPSRMHTGIVKLRLDNEWRTRTKQSNKIIITALTWPLLLKYGYWNGKES